MNTALTIKKNKMLGFTLIELLVVISIIGLLSSVVLSALNTARSKARDTQRVRDLGELRKALALYYDKNGGYPDTAYDEYTSATASWNTAGNPLYALVTQSFISKLPIDPKNTPTSNSVYVGANSYGYYYTTGELGPTAYELVTRLENAGSPSSCEKRGSTYCQSSTWSGWNWQTSVPFWNGVRLVVYRP